MRTKRVLTILGISLLALNNINAQEADASFGSLITDRPDATESSFLMRNGAFQLETGFIYEKQSDHLSELENYTFNTMLLRYGLLDNLELRLGWNLMQEKTYFRQRETGERFGFDPFLVGAKIGIAEENGILPQIALLGHMYFPFTASKEFMPEDTGVDFRFAFSHTLSERSGLAYNLGAEWPGDANDMAYIYTIAYGYSLTDNLGAFVELYGDMPENNPASHYFDGGFTYLVSDNFQLDAYAGFGLNNDQDLLLGAGFSFRIPKN